MNRNINEDGALIRIMFVCHGNICRSPLAEFIMKDLLRNRAPALSQNVLIRSAATSTEELGNPVYPPVRRVMREHGIPFEERRAVRLAPEDYEKYDHFILMDRNNLRNIRGIFPADPEKKIRLLFPDRDVADPWFYGNFEQTYEDILRGCTALLEELIR